MKPLLTPIILCGPGANLYPLCDAASSTSSSTKALLPLANRPMLAFALQSVLSAGFSHCLVLAHSAHHPAIVRSLSHFKLVCPPAVQGVTPSERKRAAKEAKEERGSIPIQFVDVTATATAAAAKDEGMLHYAMTSSAVASMSVELLPLGPHDVTTRGMTANGSHSSGGVDEKTINLRLGPLGTAELLRWLDSMNKLHSDPLILPVDLVAPAFPLRDLIDAYVQAQARRPHAPTVCCALYERGAGEGVGREREREGPPRLISAFSTDREPSSSPSSSSSSAASHRLLFLRDSDLSEDLAIRRSLLAASPRTRISTSLLDAHAYILNKAHVLPLLRANPNLTSLRDHVIPLVAKASWQRGLREKVGWRPAREEAHDGDRSDDELDADIDALQGGLQQSQSMTMDADALQEEAIARSSRLPASTTISATRHVESGGKAEQDESIDCIAVVVRLNEDSQISGQANFVARANTVATYLECNRWLLKALSAAGEMQSAMAVPEEPELANGTTSGVTTSTINNNNNSSSSSIATSSLSSTATSQAIDVQNQATTIASSAQISQDSLLGRGVRVGDRASVKRSVVGNHCEIGRGARLAGCILMDHVKVGENAKLENVICCVNSAIGERSTLKDCDVAASVTIAAETNAKNEKLVGEQESDEDDEEGYEETSGNE